MSGEPPPLGVCTLSSSTIRGARPQSSASCRANPHHSGYLSKIEVRALGVISRRRYWFALSDTSPYLYWYKERDDVECIGRLCLTGAAFTYNPRLTGRFEIHSGDEVFVLETTSNRSREEWMICLQEARKRSWDRTRDSMAACASAKDIISLTSPSASAQMSPSFSVVSQSLPEPLHMHSTHSESPAASPRTPTRKAPPVPVPTLESNYDAASIDDASAGTSGRHLSENEPLDDPSVSGAGGDRNHSTASAAELLSMLGGPVTDGIDGDDEDDSTPTEENPARCFPMMRVVELPENSSTFYLDTDGQLNNLSMEMPKVAPSPEAILSGLAGSANSYVEAPRRALERARRSFKRLSTSKTDCEECVQLAQRVEEAEWRQADAEDRSESLEQMINALKKALMVANRQVDMLKEMHRTRTVDGGEEDVDFLLEREAAFTLLQLDANEASRKAQELEERNRELETRVCELLGSLEAFRESVRTKEQLIMKLCEEQNTDGSQIIGDIEVPEGILVDLTANITEDAAQKVFCEESVRDVHEMKDLVDGYRSQNNFLNQEIVELHSIIRSLEEREKSLTRKNFDVEACYYQLKSRYIMVLNHFKNPQKPGKIMEPGVLRELLQEAGRTPTHAHTTDTDTLGFYLRQEDPKNGDLLEKAADCMSKADNIVVATQLEQSEDYMKWLQSWDGFLVNCVHRPLTQSAPLKALVRSGVPPAYRSRVWKSLVGMWVRDQIAELGNGYYDCMLRKAKAIKERGDFDSAIKQIDLDLSRTLPTNKFFEDPSSNRVESLRRVLYAFRFHNKEVGYCQGLNRLAAIGLLYLEEEDAFWFLVACVEHLQPEGYYTSTLIGAVADQKVLRDLVGEKLPKFAAHLKSMEVDLSLFTLGWFLTCFVDVLPHNIYLNIFDVFLYEGNKVLFRMALSVLRLGESRVLQCKTIGTVHATLSRAHEFVVDFNALSMVAFKGLDPFPTKAIETKRTAYLTTLREQGYS